MHEIPIENINLEEFTEEEYDKKTTSQLVKDTVNDFKEIIEILKQNGKDITKLPLNAGLRELEHTEEEMQM